MNEILEIFNQNYEESEKKAVKLEALRRFFVVISLTAAIISFLLALDIGWSAERREEVAQNIQTNTLIFCAIACVASLCAGFFQQREIDKEFYRFLKLANEISTEAKSIYYKPFTCRNCHYYSQNSFLKCAVNPIAAVGTDESINCKDFIKGEIDLEYLPY